MKPFNKKILGHIKSIDYLQVSEKFKRKTLGNKRLEK